MSKNKNIQKQFELSDDTSILVFSFLPMEDLKSVSLCNSHFYKLSSNNMIWKSKYEKYTPQLLKPKDTPSSWKKLYLQTPKWLINKTEWFVYTDSLHYGNCTPEKVLDRSYAYDMNGEGFNAQQSFYMDFDFKKEVKLSGFRIFNLGDGTHDVKRFGLFDNFRNSKILPTCLGRFSCKGYTSEGEEFYFKEVSVRYLRFQVYDTQSPYQAVIREIEFLGH